MDDLWVLSDWYNKLIEGNESDFQTLKNGQKIFKSLFAIRLMGVSQCYVLFLSILRNYEKKTYQMKKMLNQDSKRIELFWSEKYDKEGNPIWPKM